MAHLITLDKKLFTVEHKMSFNEIKVVEEKHNISKDELTQQIQRELYQKFTQGIHKNIQTKIITTPEGDEIFRVAGYVLSELNMMELIQECLEMDEHGKEMLLDGITKAITYRDKSQK